MNRVLPAARLHLIGIAGTLAWTWGIPALSLAINIAIFGATPAGRAGEGFTGGLLSLYVVLFVAYVQTATQLFRWAVATSLTRRAYLAGTALFAGVQSLVYGVVLVVLLQVERATDGWGAGVEFFGIEGLVQDNAIAQLLVYAVPMLLTAALGTFFGGVQLRWGNNGTLAAMALGVLALGVAGFTLTRTDSWAAFGEWLGGLSGFGVLAGCALVGAASGAASYLVLRRATP